MRKVLRWILVVLASLVSAVGQDSLQQPGAMDPDKGTLRSLAATDLGESTSMFPDATVTITQDRLLCIDPLEHRLDAFALNGSRLGWVRLASEEEPDRMVGRLQPLQDDVLIHHNRAFVSLDGKIHVWEVSKRRPREPVTILRFASPVRLLKVLDDDRLLIVQPTRRSLFLVTDPAGEERYRFGRPLTSVRHAANEEFNQFFAFFHNGEVVVLFRFFPVYRRYSLEGDLLLEGRYELSPHAAASAKLNPSLATLQHLTEKAGSRDSLFDIAVYHGGRFYLASRGVEIAVLNDELELGDSRMLVSLNEKRFPDIIGIDPYRDRLLVRERYLKGTLKDGIFHSLRYVPIMAGEKPR
ncbi:MAG TPA: hypothetical protein VLV83_26435 [Acidobacteriota bacterium]|nr:hypothetical protein [Acidobacteriota bacterium]